MYRIISITSFTQVSFPPMITRAHIWSSASSSIQAWWCTCGYANNCIVVTIMWVHLDKVHIIICGIYLRLSHLFPDHPVGQEQTLCRMQVPPFIQNPSSHTAAWIVQWVIFVCIHSSSSLHGFGSLLGCTLLTSISLPVLTAGAHSRFSARSTIHTRRRADGCRFWGSK